MTVAVNTYGTWIIASNVAIPHLHTDHLYRSAWEGRLDLGPQEINTSYTMSLCQQQKS